MNHHETIALAEQHRTDLIEDAARARRRHPRARHVRPVRTWLARRRELS